MTNKQPSAEDIAIAKAVALSRSTCASDELIQIDTCDAVTGFEATILAAPLTLADWKENFDLTSKSRQMGDSKLFATLVLFPPFEAAQRLRGEHPAMIGQVRSELLAQAGFSSDSPTISKLVKENRPPCLSAEDAVTLTADNPRGLFVVTFPCGFVAVCKAPTAELYQAGNAARAAANAASLGIVDSGLSFSTDLILRSSEPVAALLERLPCTTSDLWVTFQMLGGMTAAVRSKRI